jgi:hypothetical protein
MATETKPLTLRINNPDSIVQLAHKANELLNDMRGINVNFTPIKWNTKARWEEQLEEICTFLNKLIPKQGA